DDDPQETTGPPVAGPEYRPQNESFAAIGSALTARPPGTGRLHRHAVPLTVLPTGTDAGRYQ
ncbi:MAG: hypothetical protein R3178_08300, partial [Rhodothermales bacterium]|nr:hypothetical protein [Rhodothermales bacterium]